MNWRIWIAAIVFSTAALAPNAPALDSPPNDDLTIYQTPYYVMHTDLAPADVREATLRMTRMAEEYHNRTRDFSGDIRERMPFFLFKDEDEYLSAGGMNGTQGVFTGEELMAFSGEHVNAGTWHVIQHEGFHQFAKLVIGGEMPTWMNEGLAEYFGYAVFTGDGYVSGIIPPAQLRIIKVEMGRSRNEGGFGPVNELMQMSHLEWNSSLKYTNYDQAWSMVQFLAHGENGKYQKPFTAMMLELGKGRDWQAAWADQFGTVVGFEQAWRNYWETLPDNPTDNKYAEATVATLTSLLARCNESNQTFTTFAQFSKAIAADTLRIPDRDWLPDSLITSTSAWVKRRQKQRAKFALIVPLGPMSVSPPPGTPPTQVSCVLADGTRFLGTYTMTQEGRVAHVNVTVTSPAGKAEGHGTSVGG